MIHARLISNFQLERFYHALNYTAIKKTTKKYLDALCL